MAGQNNITLKVRYNDMMLRHSGGLLVCSLLARVKRVEKEDCL